MRCLRNDAGTLLDFRHRCRQLGLHDVERMDQLPGFILTGFCYGLSEVTTGDGLCQAARLLQRQDDFATDRAGEKGT